MNITQLTLRKGISSSSHKRNGTSPTQTLPPSQAFMLYFKCAMHNELGFNYIFYSTLFEIYISTVDSLFMKLG